MTSQELAKQIRISSLKMCNKAKASHIGGCLSCADILAVLYNEVLTDNDKLIISKGHCAAAVYSVLALTGKIPTEWLDGYCQDGAKLGGHVTYGVPGVEVSTGSLGHGLSIGCGMAIADKSKRVFVLLSDGELNEGSVWEAAMFAAANGLYNLITIVDYNNLQSFCWADNIVPDVVVKWGSFRWITCELSGGDEYDTIPTVCAKAYRHPTCIIVHTIKGNGVSFMENRLEWHYKYPDDEELKLALGELK